MPDGAVGSGSRERAVEFRAMFQDERRFRRWYDAALPTVYGYVVARCGGIREVAEELTQEAFVEAVRSRHRFDGRSDPTTWVCAIARHRLLDHYRRRERDDRRRLRLLDGGGETAPGTEPVATEERDAVLRTLRQLPPMQQAALVLHYLDDLPVSQIAYELGRSEAAVESLLARGRDGFRRVLAAGEEAQA